MERDRRVPDFTGARFCAPCSRRWPAAQSCHWQSLLQPASAAICSGLYLLIGIPALLRARILSQFRWFTKCRPDQHDIVQAAPRFSGPSSRSGWQSGLVERLIGSIRRECLDHVIVFGEAHLRRVPEDLGFVLQRGSDRPSLHEWHGRTRMSASSEYGHCHIESEAGNTLFMRLTKHCRLHACASGHCSESLCSVCGCFHELRSEIYLARSDLS